MRKNRRRSLGALALAAAVSAAALVGLGGCASQRPLASGPAPTPAEAYRALLGSNPGLTSLRAVSETRILFAGKEVSLPGVLLLDSYGGFRLDLLDPLDRPLAMLFAEEGRVVSFRPAQALASSLGVLPVSCRGIETSAWVPAILASSLTPAAGERIVDRRIWGVGRVLERRRGSELYQSIGYGSRGGQALPQLVSWYCDEEPVLQLRFREWATGTAWRLPTRFDILYPKAGLEIRVDLSEIEGNPPPSSQPLRPKLGPEIRWTNWYLPQ
jgi:hypothetical protein